LASNETFELLCSESPITDPRPGLDFTPSGQPNTACASAQHQFGRIPYVYMGPGIFYDRDLRKVFLRLDSTNNAVPGLSEFVAGLNASLNANDVPIALFPNGSRILLDVRNSEHVIFRSLGFRHGDITISIRAENGVSKNIKFDKVEVGTGASGFEIGGPVVGFTLTRSIVDGGIPPWIFRSDLKDNFCLSKSGDTCTRAIAAPAEGMLGALVFRGTASIGTKITNNILRNAHDMYVTGTNVTFARNHVHNLHDEALVLEDGVHTSGSISENLFEQVLHAFSFAIDAAPSTSRTVHIHGNVVDLRKPIAGYRPFNPLANRLNVWRYGAPFKPSDSRPESSVYVDQNTFVTVSGALGDSTAPRHLMPGIRVGPSNVTRFVNNIVVDEALSTPVDAISRMRPPPPFNVSTGFLFNRNLYFRRLPAPQKTPLFTLYPMGGPALPVHEVIECDGETTNWKTHSFYNPSKYESESQLCKDPLFVSWPPHPVNANPTIIQSADFRLSAASPAKRAGGQFGASLAPFHGPLQPFCHPNGFLCPSIGALQGGSQLNTGPFAPQWPN
jgi:hypothetical protein